MELLRVKSLLYIDFIFSVRYKEVIGEVSKISFDHWSMDISREVGSMAERTDEQAIEGSEGTERKTACFLRLAGETQPMCLHFSILEIIVANIL